MVAVTLARAGVILFQLTLIASMFIGLPLLILREYLRYDEASRQYWRTRAMLEEQIRETERTRIREETRQMILRHEEGRHRD